MKDNGSRRDRTGDVGWIPVINNHRRNFGGESSLFSLFVDNLPDKADKDWLFKLFNNYGVVKDAFVPLK